MAPTNTDTTRILREPPSSQDAPARLIGADTVVPGVDGRPRPYANLDYAASTPVMAALWEASESIASTPAHRPGGPAMQRARPVRTSRRMSEPWGMLAAIDLHGCCRRRLEDPKSMRLFVASVIEAIGMRAHGPLRLERFGNGELEGWSAMQFIETSSITIHADEFSGRCFVDVFSCRRFDAEIAAAIAVAHFGGRPTLRVLQR
jgi:S-adenosylmethionine decarboxylase